MIWKIGEFALVLLMVSMIIFYTAKSEENILDTQEYVTKQNYSDAYAEKYASLSAFDADSVGKISVQEAVNLIFTYAGDTTPVVVKGPDGKIRVFASDKDGWNFSSNGKPFGQKIDAQGNYYNGSYNTNVGVLNNIKTEPVPAYNDLYNYLSAFQASDVYYYCNINPDNQGTLETILLVATN